MSHVMQRVAGAVGTVLVAALVNVATGFFTDHDAVTWWVSGGVLLAVGTVVQWWLPVAGTAATGARQTADGNTVGGSLRQQANGRTVQEASNNQVTGDLDQDQHG